MRPTRAMVARRKPIRRVHTVRPITLPAARIATMEVPMHEDPALRNLPPRADAIAARHEVEDLELGGIKGFAVVFFLLIGVSLVVVWIVFRVLLGVTSATDGP